jgi:hypothetical protein
MSWNSLTYIGIHDVALESVYMHIDMYIYIGICDSVLDGDENATSSSCDTWTILRGYTCFLGPFLEVLRWLEHIS